MTAGKYDVIVVGARVAGAAIAMLLARRGLRVLAVDRARFPSDTLSTHQIQLPGVAALRRWDLLDRLISAGTPAARSVRFDPGPAALTGRFLPFDGVDALYSPRRTVLDTMLVEAARTAGAEVRENFLVEDLVWAEQRVVGIRGFERGSPPVTETAPVVIGADGKRSLVARRVNAESYRQREIGTFACYTYWSGVHTDGGELYQRPGRAVAVFPTNGDLVMIFVEAPLSDFGAFRADTEAAYLATVDHCGDLGKRVRDGVRAERFRSTPDLPHTFRQSYGPGWALVGDAGVTMDPVSAQGITNAFRGAELLCDAVVQGLTGKRGLAAALAQYQHRRDAAFSAMYSLTAELARLRPPTPLQRRLYAELANRPGEIDRFLDVFAGVTPAKDYFMSANTLRMLGVRGLGAALATLLPWSTAITRPDTRRPSRREVGT
jgi:2-polyprenyl-6-methoxyphenol hydroxylase-like FAD-dependent oxidoreductase